ncbi:hypothetical protein Ais01nite_36850 [Asanoa ishikariensis]|uniref:Uncharacterized conserved protein YeaO, DUF488 family n=1 Tax=Asanoa ishikariensis TaxID=137265 RepID=A0A1H3LR47_9ACTN|nr:DUF488 family protein [Asanoa ishikariensis]GIF65650.1 hypothetical protein Ais01nite_36850 [Asanoa ishikariensis]SDY67037.1 Uncharacterized conserved protein YeaO, DUF488 family [Asanoa ishikariensis]
MRLRRVYDEIEPGDGKRVLVDRIWPRGVHKGSFDEWLKEVAPSTELRHWYGHDPDKFSEFRRRYLAELKEPEQAGALDQLRTLQKNGPVTLLTATKDVEISHAAVLLKLLQ